MTDPSSPSPAASRPVGIVGTGYVGLVTGLALAELGHRVVCLDVDRAKVAALQAGRAPFHEPGVDDLLVRHAGAVMFTTEPAQVFGPCPVVFVTVDTPPGPGGDADLSRVEAVVATIPAGTELVMVMKSTVPAGTGRRITRHLRATGRHSVRYVSNPEFLREGSAVHDVLHPERVVLGADNSDAAEAVAALWEPLGAPVVACDVASAEMVKLAANAFLATKISFVNEIANVCDAVGADVATVARGMGLDSRIGAAFLNPGIGYGGSCFPKDVAALKQLAGNSGYHFQLLSAVIEVNELQKRRIVVHLADRLGQLQGARIALLGLAFKPGTDDLREASSLVLAARLAAEGASLVVHDPVVGDQALDALPAGTVKVARAADALAGADAAIVVTEWPEYLDLVHPALASSMARPLLVDGRNLIDPDAAASAGFEWVGVGRPDCLPDALGALRLVLDNDAAAPAPVAGC
ncbi:MAG: UDP-glucose/GDP-mannose dehydrogenase family protein [Acidimicrobiia bacterium]|nr:UDP-glucose/GDP-mannose dehydrogenase family protein [Acidimicrobiia bacterium]